ncbi:hypothetical protein ACVXHA_18145 [Escherichia coli]
MVINRRITSLHFTFLGADFITASRRKARFMLPNRREKRMNPLRRRVLIFASRVLPI